MLWALCALCRTFSSIPDACPSDTGARPPLTPQLWQPATLGSPSIPPWPGAGLEAERQNCGRPGVRLGFLWEHHRTGPGSCGHSASEPDCIGELISVYSRDTFFHPWFLTLALVCQIQRQI